MSGRRQHRCDPEEIFELADGALGPERELIARDHLGVCSSCREVYQRELELNACLGSLELGEPRSVCRSVAMALPTRPVKARLVWSALAAVLLVVALPALMLNGAHPLMYATDVLGFFWGYVAGLEGAARTMFAVVGPVLLYALAVGAFLDLLIAAVVFSATRRRTREA